MIIIGAGMAGLLAGNILREFSPVLFEQGAGIPDNHKAVLRFKTRDVSQATSIPFKQVKVMKGIVRDGRVFTVADLQSCNMYALKNLGFLEPRSIMNLEPETRYIAPTNFVRRMARDLDIRTGTYIGAEWLSQVKNGDHIISTMPLPALLKILGINMEGLQFNYKPITVITAEITTPVCDVYQTLYFPDPQTPIYRASITKNRLIVECSGERRPADSASAISEALSAFGFKGDVRHDLELENINSSLNPRGKISTTTPHEVKQMIFRLSQEYGIYSLGRFACWKHVVMDDLVDDINFIRELVEAKDSYQAVKRTHS